ncbi:hypothetical protein [Burkholderia ubonensis]|uniref:hypothetical protein n=1 Tax=Burkholderia ubonensis TaxID=101571 RepID=UPI000752B567|nr:hypothetical protein [Burkholderia ubonensis]KVL70366.1 hypothetical protein WJ49_22920 [Burkholderia ubonensis]KVL73229.1 hypothetical protein WJ48_00615 [Burkholderia ubonensis]KVL91057.1 hypothetical protein WJ50_13050 [Burkholderia ubonensis]
MIVASDAGSRLRRTGLPAEALAILLQMAAGDETVLFEYDGPALVLVAGGMLGVGRARIVRRCDGQWRVDALWTLRDSISTRLRRLRRFSGRSRPSLMRASDI